MQQAYADICRSYAFSGLQRIGSVELGEKRHNSPISVRHNLHMCPD